MKIVAEYEIRESEVEVVEEEKQPWHYIAHNARIHDVEGTDVDVLRVIVRACSVLWVWRSSGQSD